MADRIPMMAPKVFWDVVEASKCDTINEQLSALHLLLVTLGPDEVVGFDNRLSHYLGEANRRDLWQAADLLCGCASEGTFRCFCWWLVLQGRAAFDGALANPDSLVDFAGLTGYEYAAARDLSTSGLFAWQELTDGAASDEYEEIVRWSERTPWPKLAEVGWDVFDVSQVRDRWPRLAALHYDGILQ
jgi:hypothetical protein